MGTYNNTIKRTYFTVSNGKFNHRDKDGNVETFTGIDGILKDIVIRKGMVNGTEKKFTDFVLEDNGEQLVVSAGLYDGVSNTILRCLANAEKLNGKLLLETWSTEKNGRTYTNISVKMDGEKMQWCDIPPIEYYTVPSGETFKSTKEREAFIDGVIEDLQSRLHGNVESAPRTDGIMVVDDEDIPEAKYEPNYQ